MSIGTKKIFWSFLLLIFLSAFCGTKIFAQGKIVGHVKDNTTGEPLIGVNIIIQGTTLGAATDLNGDYVIVNVPIGTYKLQASMIGYAKELKTDVVVSFNQITRIDFNLEASAVQTKEIIVTAPRDILHKDVSSSQIVVTDKQITNTAGVRTLQDFLNTQAGITDNSYLEIRGGGPSETGTIVNGLPFVNARVGKTDAFIPTSGIEQVSLNAGGMNAEYGQFRSGLIDVTTKTGTMDGYHGTFSFTQSPAHIKRFGPSLYDPMNNYLRPHLDPTIAFIGVSAAVQQGIITPYQAQQFGQYPSFNGFLNLTGRNIPASWRTSLKPGQEITPVDMYLYDAWMHMVNPNFALLNQTINKLNAQGLNVGTPVTDQNLINAFSNHANKEGQYGDFNFDGGFGGPIPFVSRALGDATFFLSNTTARTSYIEPLELQYDLKSTTMLAMKSNLSKGITLKLTGIYGYEKGMNPARAADSEPATLSIANQVTQGGVSNVYQGLDRGAFVPENDIPLFTSYGSNYGPAYYWYQTMLQPWIENNYLGGFELSHAISATTYYDVKGSYQATKEDINPDLSSMRNNTPLAYAGPIPLTEAPYGREILPLGASEDTVAGFVFDQYLSVPGLSERFDSKGGLYYDNSLTQQVNLQVDFGSQVTKEHFIKAGFEYYYTALNNNRWSYWPNQGPLSMYEYNFNVYPRTVGAYVQDQITFEDMIANIGIRADYYSFGNLEWPTGRPWDADAFAAPNWTPADYLSILQSGGSIIWQHWNQLNAQYIAEGQTPLLQPVATHLVFSPRFGISFPITDNAKFYFNYGQFRSMPPLADMLAYGFRYDTQKGGLYDLGNPNLAPSKTIQYELGVDYNLFNEYLIHIAGYYKDVTGNVRVINYVPATSGIPQYRFRSGDSYATIQGLEFQVTKSVGEYITGWLNLQYTYSSSGITNRIAVYQDSASNVAPAAFTYANPSRPFPVPEIRANITLTSPSRWGQFLGDWSLSLLPDWRLGDIFVFNPRGTDEGATNYFRWPNLWLVNMKLSKAFTVGPLSATVFLNVNNLFNNKQFLYNYAFYGGNGSASGSDFTSYMQSLHLSEYRSSYYDAIRSAASGTYLYPGYVYTQDVTDDMGMTHHKGDVVTTEDKIGDMNSSAKPWINSPNVDLFSYGYTRSVWLGIKFDF